MFAMGLALLNIVLCLACLALEASAYIPALPTNNTQDIQAGLNLSDSSMLQLQWFPNAYVWAESCCAAVAIG